MWQGQKRSHNSSFYIFEKSNKQYTRSSEEEMIHFVAGSEEVLQR
jgi:hypothetical protein